MNENIVCVIFAKAVLAILLSFRLILCQSNFDVEYPGVKICPGANSESSNLQDVSAKLKELNVIISSNCTHIQGNLYIKGLLGMQGKSISLDSIREIGGHLVIELNEVEQISLKNLVVIRGSEFRSLKFVNGSGNANLSLQVTSNSFLRTLNLVKLRSIDNYDVFFDNNPHLRYLPHKIKWDELFSNPLTQKVHLPQISKDSSYGDICHNTCRVWIKNNSSFCWGPLNTQCQKKTLCEKLAGSCQRCLYENGEEKNCCNQECIGGCFGFSSTECLACRQMLDGKKCVADCSRATNSLSNVKKPFTYISGSFCSSTCPDYMLTEKAACLHHCSDGFYKNEDNQCLECHESLCKNEIPCDMIKMGIKSEKDFILNKNILMQLKNCTKLLGYILINKLSFTKFNVTVEMIYDNLKNLEELEGGFAYEHDSHLNNLTFLAKLRSFRTAKMKNFEVSRIYQRFSIMKTNLKFLGLKSLKSVQGLFIIGENYNMSYVNLPWQEFIKGKYLIIPKIKPEDKCDKECSSKGCWMSGNNWCYECRNFEAKGQCVSDCSSVNGYFLSKSFNLNGTCDKCDNECAKTCNGITAANCIGGCVHNEENGVCIRSCSDLSYEEKGTHKCQACHQDCFVLAGFKSCSGPSNKPGLGGCNICSHILINKKNDSKEEMVKCVTQCPRQTFSRLTKNEEISKFFYKVGYVCENCDVLCEECTGPKIHREDCVKCKGFWYKDICTQNCSAKLTYGSVLLNSIKHCLPCSSQCVGGCTGPTPYDCTKCKYRKVINGTKFYCVSTCPVNKTIEEINKATKELLCVAFWESQSKRDEWEKLKNILIIVIIMTLVIFMTVTVIIFCLRKKASAERLSADLKARYSNLTEPNSKDENAFSQPPNMGRLVIISKEDLMFEDETKPLGYGAFGCVYKGKWRVPRDENQIIRKATGDFFLPVAIKVIKSIGKSEIDAIMQEAKVMASVSHLHCLRFIGISLSYENPCIVTAYVKEGSLDKFLSRNRPKITSLIMLSWAEQIADGMLYLTKRGIIHRDLAARNVLISRLECVQITDFGLSKMLESTKEREIVIKIGKVPFRWLAIETLLEGKYSFETDVWAYGVTLWEIFTFGKVPYEDQATSDISDFIMRGGRLSQPNICSLDVYMVMVNCWLESPNLRPDFEVLMKTFMEFCNNPGRYLSIQGDPFEIPSPSNIEMSNFNNYYDEQFKCSPGTAETVLPLLSDRDSIEFLNTSKISRNSLAQNEGDFQNIIYSRNPKDLPTRSENKTSHLLKGFHEKTQINQANNNTQRTVPLASLEEPSFKEPSTKDNRSASHSPENEIRNIKSPQNLKMNGSQTPRFHSNPYLKPSDELLHNLSPPPKPSNHDNSVDGYLEPIHRSNFSHPSNMDNVDNYLENTTSISNENDDYLTPSYQNSAEDSLLESNTYVSNASSQSLRNGSDRTAKHSILKNIVDDEYLEPLTKENFKKS